MSADLLIFMDLLIQLLGFRSDEISLSLRQAYAHVSSEKIKESMNFGILYNRDTIRPVENGEEPSSLMLKGTGAVQT